MRQSVPASSLRVLLALFITIPTILFPPTSPPLYAIGPTVVTTTSLLNDPNDGACSLREALQAAFLQQVNGTASQTYNECTVYAGPTTITFGGNAAAGVIKLTADQDPLPMINKAVIIVGPVLIQGGGRPPAGTEKRDTRLFQVAADGNLTLMTLTLKDGYTSGFGGAIYGTTSSSVINLSGVALIGNMAEGNGGAIYTSGALNVLLSSFSGNQALGLQADGITDSPTTGFGGAIESGGTDQIRLAGTNFSGNIASKGGGALSNIGATLLISDTVFTGNIANAIGDNDGGGALMNRGGGGFTIARSFFSANLTPKGSGGAIYHNLNSTPGQITDSAFTANIAGDLAQGGLGGAIYNEEDLLIKRVTFNGNIATGDGRGGAILNNRAALLRLANATFFSNFTPEGKGGAIANVDTPFPVSADSTVDLRNVTLSSNRANSGGALYNEELLTLANTIVEEGATGSGGTCAGTKPVTDNGHNLQDPGTACGNTMQSAGPALDFPKPAGGPLVWLLVQAPKAGSPAIDQGDEAICSADPVNNVDATDSSRPKNGDSVPGSVCDIGAVEAGTALPGFGSEPAQPGPIEFGNVQVGTFSEAGFMVSETGILPLTVVAAELSGNQAGDFSVLSALPIIIANGGPAQPVTLRCTPTAEGLRTATLSLVTDDPKSLKVDYDLVCNGTIAKVPGFAAEPIAPGPIDLGTVYVGATATQSFAIKESGNATLQVSQQSISGDNAADFTVISGLPATIAEAGAAASVSVRCVPTAIGIRTAQLNLTTNDPTQPTVTFDLICKGAAVPTPYLAAPGTSVVNLDGAYGVVVSPDARHVYVTNHFAGTLSLFSRDLTSGQLTTLGAPLTGLAGARKVAISPDGQQLYVAAGSANSFTIYNRDGDSGQLTLADSYTNNAIVQGLTGAHGVGVSPDGRNIYVTGAGANALVTFSRDADDFVGYADTLSDTDDLAGARSVVVSPDGQHVYVSGYKSTTHGNVAVYSRNQIDGTLTHLQNWSEGSLLSINPIRFLDGLAGAHALTLSPEGAFLYVAGLYDNSLVIFSRNPLTGRLSYLRTYKDGVGGFDALGGTTGVTISADGKHLYTTALNDRALGLFDRDPATGLLSFVESFARDAGTGLPKLEGANEAVISPDGATVYTVAGLDDAVTAFAVANPQATLESLLPASVPQGATDFTLVVKGKNFVGGSQIVWQGTVKPTTYISTGEVRTTISAAEVVTAGSAAVKVVNPAPGGGDSANQATFTITAPGENPQPSIDYITPQSVEAAVQQFTLSVFGANFVQGAVVRYNGVTQPTTFVSSNQLDATVGTAAIQAALAAQDPDLLSAAAVDDNQPAGVTVQNPAPGGGISNPVLFTVLEAGQNPAPSLSALQPLSIVEQGAGSSGLTITVIGQNFLETAQAQWNGAPRTTKFVSSSQLQVTLQGGDIAFAGSGSLTVSNPAPGGGTSNAQLFTVQPTPLNPTPTIATVTPNLVPGVGQNASPTLELTGSNFLPSAGVYLDSVLRPSSYVDSSHLHFTLTMTDLLSSEGGTVTVINPPPGGGASNGVALTILQHGLWVPLVQK